jgi:hypothetical protein
MTIRRYVQTALVLSALAFATTSHADDAAMAEAQARFKEGLDLADGGKFEEARLKFLQASVVLKAPAVLYNLATTEQKTGHDVEAVDHYRAFLKGSVNDTRITDAMREKARQNITTLLPKVAQVDIVVSPTAKVSVDGKPLDETPKEPVAVTGGRHTIEVSLSGKVKSVDIDAVVGEVTRAKVDFDGSDSTTTAPPPVSPSSERTKAGWIVPITLGVLGVGGLVMGGVFASASQSSKDDSVAARRAAPGLCAAPGGPACDHYRSLRDDASSQATLSYVGYVSGGVLLAASVATFIFWPKSSSSSPAQGMRLAPIVGSHGGGGTFQFSF